MARRQSAPSLVEDFLQITAHLPRHEVAAIARVSLATLARWEIRPPSQLRAQIRDRLAAYVEEAECTAGVIPGMVPTAAMPLAMA